MTSDATPPAPSSSSSPPSTPAPTAPPAVPSRTLLPSRQLYNKAVRRDLGVAAPVLVLILVTQLVLHISRRELTGDPMSAFMVWLIVGLFAAGTIFVVVHHIGLTRNTRIDITATGLTVTNWLGRSTHVPTANIATLIQTNVRLPRQSLPMLFLLDPTGRRLLTMYGTLWPTEAMLEVGTATGLPPTTFPTPISYRELRKRYPKAVGWARANPMALASIIVGSTLLVIVIGLAVVFALFL